MGAVVPADNIIATIVSFLGSLSLPLVLPFAHRFGRRVLLRGTVYMSMVTVIILGLFAMRVPFDKMHQRRIFIIHQEDVGRLFFIDIFSMTLC